MNDMRRIPRAALPAALCLLAACSSGAREEPPLAGAAIGGPFALTSENDVTIRDTDFAGQYRMIYFGYTFCPDVCPVDMQNLGRGLRLFEERDPEAGAKVQPIFVSVDPDRDSPEVLRQFTDAFHPRFLGLTGTPAQLADVAREYAVVFHADRAQGDENYLVEHSRIAYLFGSDGEPIALIPQDETPEAVADTLARWVR